MKKTKVALRHRVVSASRGIAGVLRLPRYAVLAVVLAVLFAGFMHLIVNSSFYWPLLVSRLPFLDKLALIGVLYGALVSEVVTTFTGVLLAAVSLLQGVAFAVLVYVLRRNKRFDAKAASGGALAMVAAAVGLGCVPCGTSILLPIVTLFFSSSAYAAATTVSQIVLAGAFVLSVYSLYRLGGIAYMHSTIEKQEGMENEGA